MINQKRETTTPVFPDPACEHWDQELHGNKRSKEPRTK
jgi:hypothetical protein